MEVSVEVNKTIECTIYSTVFLGEGVDDVLVRLSLIEKILKDPNLMSI